jgi:hypothetical protein
MSTRRVRAGMGGDPRRLYRTEKWGIVERVNVNSRRSSLAAVFLSCLLLVMLGACQPRGSQERIIFPSTPVLSIRSTWAVVKSPLLRVRVEATNKSSVLSHIRMGVVVEVIARSDKEEAVEDETAFWYRINYEGLKGWVFGSYLEVFETRAKAEKFAESLK